MKPFVADLESQVEDNRDYRRVIYTGTRMQLVLMTLQPGEETGEEVHPGTDQYFKIEQGWGKLSIQGREFRVDSDIVALVPAGARHNIKNTGVTPLKLYTLYAPPEHPGGTVHRTKAEAEAAPHEETFINGDVWRFPDTEETLTPRS